MCNACRSSKLDGNYRVKQIYDNFIDNPIEPSPDEMIFEDEPNVEVDDTSYKKKGHTNLPTRTVIDDF